MAGAAEHGVTHGQKRNGPGERSNECTRDIDSRGSSRSKIEPAITAPMTPSPKSNTAALPVLLKSPRAR